ncbi:MAG: twitching motility protein PilT [Saprospiraceae bacterium]
MSYLMDTDTLLWYLKKNPNLPERVCAIIENPLVGNVSLLLDSL